ncbi:fimbrial protein [Serratia nevei]|uniref:fimbrial protein n=1 Tax=Serratia nevei TaxID=2703794 RepID=UPI003FA7A340
MSNVLVWIIRTSAMRFLSLTVLVMGLLYSTYSCAADITIKVAVLEQPSCVINGERPIEVDFGDDVIVNRVDGRNYSRPIGYTLNCGGGSGKLKMQLRGSSAAFDSQLLQTSNGDLGIALLRDGNRVAPNSWMNFNYGDVPILTAVPVKRPGSVLKGGLFTAGATMLIAYQ